ncbi:MAG: hypothetical protein AAF694_04125 [Bacteroidota bacterium]
MPSLQVRNVPEALYQALKAAAKRERRSINQQAIVALEKGLEDQAELNLHRKKILDKIESEKERWKDWNSLDIVKLIREDRES